MSRGTPSTSSIIFKDSTTRTVEHAGQNVFPTVVHTHDQQCHQTAIITGRDFTIVLLQHHELLPDLMMDKELLDVGFVGLGAMGMPMVENLAKKLPDKARIFVHDVEQDLVNSVVSQYPGRFVACSNARSVAEASVSGFELRLGTVEPARTVGRQYSPVLIVIANM